MQTTKIFILTLFVVSLISGAVFAQTASFTIKAANEKFSPSTITVKAGQTVKLKINAKKDNDKITSEGYVHSWTVKELDIDFMLTEGVNNVSFVAPDTPGTYKIECTVECGGNHEYMTGKLVVK